MCIDMAVNVNIVMIVCVPDSVLVVNRGSAREEPRTTHRSLQSPHSQTSHSEMNHYFRRPKGI